jgi:hypothetical protein
VKRGGEPATFAPALVLTVVLTCAAALLLIAAQLLVLHPHATGLPGMSGQYNQQRQAVKTDVYLITFLVILPLTLIAAPRLADRVASASSSRGLEAYAALMSGSLAAVLIGVRLSGGLPWGTGVKGLLAGLLAWGLFAGLLTWSVPRSAWLLRLAEWMPVLTVISGLLVFGLLLCLTSKHSLGALPLALAGAAAVAVLVGFTRLRLPHLGRWGIVVDGVVIALVLLAIPDLVVFRDPSGIPGIYFDPGIVQFQHDYILGPTNQLLGGGALLAGDPVSQYGVGLIYFVAAWGHVARIGYGTLGFLDGLLTALFYGAGYAVLRLAGVRRPLAVAALGLGVVALVYNFLFYVGQLPEEGPLRFGLPMLVVLGNVAGLRVPRLATVARVVVLCALGISGVWALEAFGYTVVTYLAVVAAAGWLQPPNERRGWVGRHLLLGLAALVAAHVIFALATLAGSGHLPDWGQYLAYVREFLFGGAAGRITYGFANWSPGLAVYAGAIASAAAVVLLVRFKPRLAGAAPARFVALAASTAYAIAVLSYTDNRSSTYLFLYVALPLLIAATIWLAVILDPETRAGVSVRRGAVAGALAVSVLLVAGAWPVVGTHFNRTALAHFYPGGGFRAALHRLWHPPAIDPRSIEGISLLDHYAPARRALILFPTVPDLGTEVLIRSRRANLLPIGDPKADSLVPTVWLPRVRAALRDVGPGRRLLIDEAALRVLADLRRRRVDVLKGAVDGGVVETEWILRELDRRFVIAPLAHAPDGLIVAELRARS